MRTNSPENYLNLNGLTDVAITCDVDWAPDFAVEAFVETVTSFGFSVTCFSTHRSEFFMRNAKHDKVEIGIHPDFTKVNISGSFKDKISNLKDIYPDSIGSRSHRNIFGQNIAFELAQAGYEYDCSTVAWNLPYLSSFRDQYGLHRFSYYWEDGLHLDFSYPFDVASLKLECPGIKIINFHPALFYLNSPKDDHRRELCVKYTDLTTATKQAFDAHKNVSIPGIQDFSLKVFQYLKDAKVQSHKMKDLIVGK